MVSSFELMSLLHIPRFPREAQPAPSRLQPAPEAGRPDDGPGGDVAGAVDQRDQKARQRPHTRERTRQPPAHPAPAKQPAEPKAEQRHRQQDPYLEHHDDHTEVGYGMEPRISGHRPDLLLSLVPPPARTTYSSLATVGPPGWTTYSSLFTMVSRAAVCSRGWMTPLRNTERVRMTPAAILAV